MMSLDKGSIIAGYHLMSVAEIEHDSEDGNRDGAASACSKKKVEYCLCGNIHQIQS